MSGALLAKTLRDAGLLIGLLVLAILLFEFLFVGALREATADMVQLRMLLERPLAQRFMQVLLGENLLAYLTATSVVSVGLAHPLLYTLSWTLLVTLGTRAICAEVDRGTSDLLLALPISRAAVYVTTSTVWLGAALLVSIVPLPGIWLGTWVFPLYEAPEFAKLWRLCVNLFAVNVSVGALTMLVGAFLSRRNHAVGWVLGGLVVSFLINVLEQFWSPARHFSFLGVLHYYRPLPIVRDGVLPIEDITTLLVIAGTAWSIGLWHFCRRDIPAA
ncbi:MAG: hypothetical protein IPM18_14305 [Phycisphaerales bacterium]|nr:hypothetical protein [Phycisphaerales bacterium]